MYGIALFSCNAMNNKIGQEPNKTVNSPRRLSPLGSPRAINLPVSAIVFEFDTKEEDGMYHVSLGEQNFKELCSSRKKKASKKNNQEVSRILVLDQHELGPLIAFIKAREGFFSTQQLKEKDEKIISLEKKIGYLNNTSTINFNDTRTFAEKNVVQIGILGFAAGVTLVTSIWLWHLK